MEKKVVFGSSPFSPFSPQVQAYQYSLEKGSKKNVCPNCGKKRFVRFVDTTSGEYLPKQYGRCDREVKCGYFLNPYSDRYYSKPGLRPLRPSVRQVPKPISCIPIDIFKRSRSTYDNNNFVKWLFRRFGTELTTELIEKYHIGSSGHWDGATVFWQINGNGRIRGGKIMLYSASNGKRVKEPFNHITWVHKVIPVNNFHLDQCLFGAHLLKAEPMKPVGLVESEKTAIIACAYFPSFVWLATGSFSNLNPKRCKALESRDVYLFPDLNAYLKWNTKALELSQVITEARFNVSDLLEREASGSDKEKGLDLADYLTRFDLNRFRTPGKLEATPEINGEKGEKGEALKTTFFSKAKTTSASGLISFEKYSVGLSHHGGMLMSDGYAASWDLTAPYLDDKTKDFLKLAIKNPRVLDLRKNLDLIAVSEAT